MVQQAVERRCSDRGGSKDATPLLKRPVRRDDQRAAFIRLGHDLEQQVQAFARLMESKLRVRDYKGGWQHCDLQWLFKRLLEEAGELHVELTSIGSNGQVNQVGVAGETVDVANIAIMIADVAGVLDGLISASRKGG